MADEGRLQVEAVVLAFAKALNNFTEEKTCGEDACREAGAIGPLVHVLSCGDPELLMSPASESEARAEAEAPQLAAAALSRLARSTQNAREIREQGGIKKLVGLLKLHGAATAHARYAAAALAEMARGGDAVESRREIIDAKAIDYLVHLCLEVEAVDGDLGESLVVGLVQVACALQALLNDHEACDLLVDVGGVDALVLLLCKELHYNIGKSADARADLCLRATNVLWRLAFLSAEGRENIREAGGIQPLCEVLAAAVVSSNGLLRCTAVAAAGALRTLAYVNSANAEAIREAGAIPALVLLLKHASTTGVEVPHGQSTEVAEAAGALWNLTEGSSANCEALFAANGVQPLLAVALARYEPLPGTSAGAEPPFLLAANALANLVAESRRPSMALSVLVEVRTLLRREKTSFSSLPKKLYQALQQAARRRVISAAELGDEMALKSVIQEARGFDLAPEVLAEAQQRFTEAAASEARRRRRLEMGAVTCLHPPAEFCCPITRDVMKDPVVASDGFSYERDAISEVLHRSPGCGLSPLTRERLQHELRPNRALSRRIAEHDTEIDQLLREVSAQALRQVAEARAEAAELRQLLCMTGKQAGKQPRRSVGSMRELAVEITPCSQGDAKKATDSTPPLPSTGPTTRQRGKRKMEASTEAVVAGQQQPSRKRRV